MSEFKGLCIGGALDGENFTAQSPEFHTPYKIETSALVKDFCEPELKSTVYHHHKIIGRKTDFELWVPSDKTIDQAFQHLLDFYKLEKKK